MTTDIVIERRPAEVYSYATGQHLPVPYQDGAGQWRCRDCGITLTRYRAGMVYRLRHHPRGRR